MHIDPLEKRWIYLSVGMAGLFFGAIVFTAVEDGIKPPSHVETVDSARLHLSEEFAEDKLGVISREDGSVLVTMVAGRYGFFPRSIEVPADTPVTFRLASMDVLHGVHVPMTNMGTMVLPGFVSQVTTVFPKPGEYPMLCNEYCGLGHDYMWSKLTVVAKQSWGGDAVPRPNGEDAS